MGVFSAEKTSHVTQERYKRVLLNIYKFIYRCSPSEIIYKLHIPLKTLYIRRCLVCKSCRKVSFNTSIFSLHKFRKNVPLNACPQAVASFIYQIFLMAMRGCERHFIDQKITTFSFLHSKLCQIWCAAKRDNRVFFVWVLFLSFQGRRAYNHSTVFYPFFLGANHMLADFVSVH